MIHPTCVIDESQGRVELSDSTVVHPNVVLMGPLIIGAHVEIYPGCVIGYSAEHKTVETDWENPIVIGQKTVLRENVVVQRPTVGGEGTDIGRSCYIMHGCHIAHDVNLYDNVTAAPKVVLGGHTTVMEGAYMGISSMTHQRIVIGSFSMVGMGAVVLKDIPPGRKWVGNPARDIGPNTVGLERAAFKGGMLRPLEEKWEAIRNDRFSEVTSEEDE